MSEKFHSIAKRLGINPSSSTEPGEFYWRCEDGTLYHIIDLVSALLDRMDKIESMSQ